jgi:hypothetical protein
MKKFLQSIPKNPGDGTIFGDRGYNPGTWLVTANQMEATLPVKTSQSRDGIQSFLDDMSAFGEESAPLFIQVPTADGSPYTMTVDSASFIEFLRQEQQKCEMTKLPGLRRLSQDCPLDTWSSKVMRVLKGAGPLPCACTGWPMNGTRARAGSQPISICRSKAGGGGQRKAFEHFQFNPQRKTQGDSPGNGLSVPPLETAGLA